MNKKTEDFLKKLFTFLAAKIEEKDTNSIEVLTIMAYLQEAKDSKELVGKLKELEKKYPFLTEISLKGDFAEILTEVR